METASAARLCFGGFELDLRTRELRHNGRLVKLQDLPVKLLALMASRPGELVTREEIEKALWGEDEFVDFEHGINTAMRKIREALGEEPEQPRFIETLPRKGYRFIAPVEAVGPEGIAFNSLQGGNSGANSVGAAVAGAGLPANTLQAPGEAAPSYLGSPAAHAANHSDDSFVLPREQARGLFLLAQVGYLAMYCAALYKAEAAQEVLGIVYGLPANRLAPLLLATALSGIAVRLYLITSVGLDHPAAGANYRRIFPVLFLLDTIWAASPLLLVRKLGLGLALAAMAAMAYLPFAQRTLMASCYKTASK